MGAAAMYCRAVAWLADKIAKLAGVVAGLCLLGLVVGGISYVFGSREFPAPFESPEETGFATYAWQVGAMIVGAFIVWRICASFAAQHGYGDQYDEYLG